METVKNYDDWCRQPEADRSSLAPLVAVLHALVREIKSYHPTFDARLFVEAERALAKARGGGLSP